MLEKLERSTHYAYRSARLVRNMVTGRPIHCNLQVTYRCNFKCAICDFWKSEHRQADELSVEDIRLMGRKLNELGTLIISLAGGEPLIREDLCEIIRVLNAEGHFPILITNGWFVNESLAKDLSQAGLQEISVSVDYANPQKHDAQRGLAGSWDRAVHALELLNRYRTSRTNRVHMITVLMDDNLDEIEPLIRLARDIGVTYMVNLYSWNRGTKARRLPGQSVTRRLLDLKRQYPEFISLTSYLEQMDQAIADGGIGNCQTGKLLMNIDSKGDVARCTETLDEPVGNLLKEDVHAIYRKLLERQRTRDCAQCWTSCRGFAESLSKAPRARQLKEFLVSVKPH
ncbi:MAG: radical SAM protein [Deltaproteobacteria bacterium]|nr:radical SAM protein [Deltaproteobacteria bacterium]